MEKHMFLVGFVLMILIIGWLGTQLGISVIQGGGVNTTLTVPVCNYTIDPTGLGCMFASIGFFFSLWQLSSSFLFLNFLVISLVIGVVYIVATLIRGGG
jgi:hypothetical protein